jgi:hypothetical protein
VVLDSKTKKMNNKDYNQKVNLEIVNLDRSKMKVINKLNQMKTQCKISITKKQWGKAMLWIQMMKWKTNSNKETWVHNSNKDWRVNKNLKEIRVSNNKDLNQIIVIRYHSKNKQMKNQWMRCKNLKEIIY